MRGGAFAAFASAVLAATVALAGAVAAQDAAAGEPVVTTPPTDPSAFAAAWEFSDPRAFGMEVGFDAEGRPTAPVLRLIGNARYRPQVRSPFNIALVAGQAFGDVTIDVEMQQSGREYGHRDLCVFFGHRGHDRFYYVHLATKADPHAHNVFLVDGAPRRAIATRTTEGVDWGASDSWHRIRVTRRGATIHVYFDDMETPIMVAEDATHGVGQVGFGSFDDEGRFRNVRITGEPVPLAADGRRPTFHRPDGGDGGERRTPRTPTR